MSKLATPRPFQFRLRHIALAIGAFAVALALVQRGRMPGIYGEGARIALVALLTTVGPFVHSRQCARQGRPVARGGALAGAVTGLALAAGLLGVFLAKQPISSKALATAIGQSLGLILPMSLAGLAWGGLIGLAVRASLRRRSSPPTAQS